MDRIGFQATAILLAGGRSSRMGEDKCLLDIRGKPLITHVLDQLSAQFDEVIVSASSPDGYPTLDVRVIPDKSADRGPLMGILSCLEMSMHELNFVQACDIPDTDWLLVEELLHRARQGGDVVMPISGNGRLEPLFAVYNRSAIPGITEVLNARDGAARAIVKTCDAHIVPRDELSITNLNDMKDYLSYVKKKWPIDRI